MTSLPTLSPAEFNTQREEHLLLENRVLRLELVREKAHAANLEIEVMKLTAELRKVYELSLIHISEPTRPY